METAKSLFILFTTRSRLLTREQAKEEFARINGKSYDEYLTSARIGANFRLNRIARRSLYLTYENAQNHAGFSAHLKEVSHAK